MTSRAASGSFLKPTSHTVWMALALGLIASLCLILPIRPHDFWWNMAIGRIIWESGTIPAFDPFSHTQPNEPFFVQGWLSQVLFYLLYSAGEAWRAGAGSWLILVFQTALIVVAYSLLLVLCRRQGASGQCAGLLIILVAIPLSASNWNVRPQSNVFVLCVAVLLILHRWWDLRNASFVEAIFRGRLWLLPILMVLWTNMHASFVVGGFLIALAWCAGLLRHGLLKKKPSWACLADTIENSGPSRAALWALLVAGGLAAGATLINPSGWNLIRYAVEFSSNPVLKMNSIEWRQPTTTDVTGRALFVSLVVLLFVVSLARRRCSLLEVMWILGLFILALQGVRYVIWFAFVVTPVLAKLLSPSEAEGFSASEGSPATTERPLRNLAFIGAIVAVVVLLLPPIKPHVLRGRFRPVLEADTPVAATKFILRMPEQPRYLFHSAPNGSYLMWMLPEHHVFIDSRLQAFYRPDVVGDYMRLNRGERVRELLAKHQIDGLLLSHVQQGRLLRAVQKLPEWQQVYADQHHAVFVPRLDFAKSSDGPSGKRR